jgi:hypothetical protein
LKHYKKKITRDASLMKKEIVGTRADPRFNTQECTNKTLTTGPFDNTCEADEVSPKVEAVVVSRLKCMKP